MHACSYINSVNSHFLPTYGTAGFMAEKRLGGFTQ